MNINIFDVKSGKIDCAMLHGDLIGSSALELQEYLYDCLDRSRLYQLLDLKDSLGIDSLGIDILRDFISRGIKLRLFNVVPDVRMCIKMARRENEIKMYKETDIDKVIELFEDEINREDQANGVKKRKHLRLESFFNLKFKYCFQNGKEATGFAKVTNMSEGGLFADNMVAICRDKKEFVAPAEIINKELYDLSFKLPSASKPVKTRGVCVREGRTEDKFWAGIRFDDNDKKSVNRIKSYIEDSCEETLRPRVNVW